LEFGTRPLESVFAGAVMITPVDFAFVSAKLHGMRSKTYEGPRLDALRSLRNVFEMMTAVFPNLDVRSRMRFEQRLAQEHTNDLGRVQVFLDGHNREFFDWQLERYRLENLKVVLRGWKAHQTPAEVKTQLVELPPDYSLPVDQTLAATHLIDVVRLVPVKLFGDGIRRGAVQFHDTNKLFYIEAGLDACYFEELCRRSGSLRAADRDEVNELLAFEVLMYDVLFAMRARLNYDIAVEDVREFLVTGPPPALPGAEFAAMLERNSFTEMLQAVPRRRVLLGPQADPLNLDELQQRLWERLYRLANRLFYRSMFHMGCVEAFYYIKRVELNNLIRVAELLKQEVSAGEIERLLIRLG